jgi:hypothetical protein
MKLSTHIHPRYIVWLKRFIFISTIVLLVELIYLDFVKYPNSKSIVSDVLDIFFIVLLYSIVMLISAYFFGQNITVTNDGLLVEFLWKELDIPWNKIIEVKPVVGFRRSTKNRKHVLVVMTDALTPFHRLIGLLYGLSLNPSIIIYPSISEYELLVETIKKHAQKN